MCRTGRTGEVDRQKPAADERSLSLATSHLN